ncbi:hypothetical protein F5Y08DRAFT_298593 [Xylaria arbuscula]|nr:hypothetical protein F5Y08DRAFT_298593 [Xylaria arbuscula]
MILENGSERHCLEVTQAQHPRSLADSESDVPLLLGTQSIEQNNDPQTNRPT